MAKAGDRIEERDCSIRPIDFDPRDPRMTMRLLPLVLCAGCLTFLQAPGVRSAAATAETAESVLARAESRFAALKDLECFVESETRLGKKQEGGTFHFWFRKPAMLRIHVTKGKTRGSDLVIDEAGKVRGRKGGLLKPFVISLSQSDKRLRNIRGFPVMDLPWSTFYRKVRERAARPGARLTLAERPDATPHQLTLRYVEAGKRMREEYRIDPELWVLTEAVCFEDEVCVDRVTFRDIRLDPGLEPKFFRL